MTPVKMEFKQIFDHLVLGRKTGGELGSDWEMAEKGTASILAIWGRMKLSWGAVVLAPPHTTKLPFTVHLAAEICT
jgi:hypothetical protein